MPKLGENWTCTFCDRAQVISDNRYHLLEEGIFVRECALGDLGVLIEAIVCANKDCRKLTLSLCLANRKTKSGGGFDLVSLIDDWRLLPASFAKPQPQCIPKALRDDYAEACAIRDLSPKASATLSRRCIQGIIREFCGISKGRLIDEIEELSDRVHKGNAPIGVHPDTVVAIDDVRKIGNIGAHMEKDINVIVDVDPEEAQTLIELIEMLFDEWYVARETRVKKLGSITAIAAQKKAAQQQPSPAPSNKTS